MNIYALALQTTNSNVLGRKAYSHPFTLHIRYMDVRFPIQNRVIYSSIVSETQIYELAKEVQVMYAEFTLS